MPRLRHLLLVLCTTIAALGFAACGGTQHHATPKPAPTIAQVCPAGHAAMGCAGRLPSPSFPPRITRFGGPSGALFPDVSSYQGALDWSAVKAWQTSHGWHPAGIFKLGEYQVDPYAARNASETARLGLWRSGYWFVRNTGCAHEASQIINSGAAYKLRVIVLDIEVPEAGGYSTCLVPAVQRAGYIVVIYTAPGTWPGGANYNVPLWVATYGSSFGCVWTCHPVAWQFTDGTFGGRVNVPGIGFDDVNVDYGLTSLGVAPVNTDPHRYLWFDRSERSVVKAYDRDRARPWTYRHQLPGLRAELHSLAGRIFVVAHHRLVHGRPSWGVHRRGWRYHQLVIRANGRKIVA